MFPVNLFPYTNFHDLNLDWILNKIKEIEIKIQNVSVPQSVLDDIASLKASVQNHANAIDDIRREIAVINSNYENLERRVTNLEASSGNISTLNVEVFNDEETQFTEVSTEQTVESGSFSAFDI